MAFRNNLYEHESDKDSSHLHSFVNRLRTHTDGELNSTPFSQFNSHSMRDDSARSFKGIRSGMHGRHTFAGLHSSLNSGQHSVHTAMTGEIVASALPLPSVGGSFLIPSNEKNLSPITRSLRKFRSSTWDSNAGQQGNLTQSLRLGSRLLGNSLGRVDNEEGGSVSLPDAMEVHDAQDGEDFSFSSSSSSESSMDQGTGKDDALGVPSLNENEGSKSSLFHDEQRPVHKENAQTISDLDADGSGLTSSAISRPSLIRGKSSSSVEGRNVRFSNMVGVQEFKLFSENEISEVEGSSMDVEKLDQSPAESDSVIYHSETQSPLPYYYQQQKHQQQLQTSQPKAKNNPLLDRFNPFHNLSWSLVGSYIVRYAPCFICMKKLGVSATDRNVLIRLNVLCAFFAVGQIAIGLSFFFVTLAGVNMANEYLKNGMDHTESDSSKSVLNGGDGQGSEQFTVSIHLWNMALFVYLLSAVNLVLLIASYFAQRAIRKVNLVRSVRFMWTLFWLIPVQIFLMIGLFDVYRVMGVYIRHWWSEPTMAWFRTEFCVDGTAFNKCIVPIGGGEEFDSEEDWCEAKYNATDCRAIRDEAQHWCESFSYVFFTGDAVWCLFGFLMMWVTLSVLQGIISLPIVERSKESNIPLWLTFPTAGCYLIGSLLMYGPSTVASQFEDLRLIALTYMVSGGAFTLAAIMGTSLKLYTVLNKRQKKCKQGLVLAFILTVVVTIFSVATIFVTSIIYSLNIIKIPTDTYHQIACMLDTGGSCTGCDATNPAKVCPEWSESDVLRVIKSIMKQSATAAATFLVYAAITLRYGFLLFRHVSSYQIDYV